jgi:uncharacterized membrane protein
LQQDADANKAMGVLAYIIWLIPLLAAPKTSRFARFHTNQGLVLFLLGVAYGIIWSILQVALIAALWASPIAAGLFTFVFGIVWLAYPVLAVIGIINAVQGQLKALPLIGGITIIR